MGFFDDFTDAIADASNTVKDKLTGIKDTTELKLEYKKAQRTVNEKMAELGRKYYEENKDAKADELSEVTEAIEKCNALKVAIDKLTTGSLECPQCGAGNDKEALYCNRCGAKLVYAEPVEGEVVADEKSGEEAEGDA